MRMKGIGGALVVLTLVGAACSPSASPAEGVRVVATTTILGDVVRQVVGDEVVVEVLLPIGADPHEFQASPRQTADLVRADLVVANGLGLEDALEDVLASVEAEGTPVLRIAGQLDPIPLGSGTDRVSGDELDDGDLDPHVWMDPLRMAAAARLIAAELERVDPGGPWSANAGAFAVELESLDAEIDNMLASVDNRVLVVNHGSLGYFADRYGFEVVGVVIPGGSTLATPSSADLAQLVSTIESLGVGAIFAETTESGALAAAVAEEVGTTVVVVDLFTGSLGGPGSGAETYLDMMRTDAALIAGVLR